MSAGMHNTEGVNVDLYIPRKCNATNRLIHAKDKAADGSLDRLWTKTYDEAKRNGRDI